MHAHCDHQKQCSCTVFNLKCRGVTLFKNEDFIIRDTFAHFESESLVIAQLGQSLDGRIATLTGESRYINGRAALEHLHRVRACVDAVVVGAGTVIADNPRLTVRLCGGRSPVRVMIDPRARVPHSVNCIADKAVRTIRIQACDAPAPDGIEILQLPAIDGQISPRAIVQALAALGLRRLLIEGGASTISNFIDSGVVDRLHVLVAPVILGSGKPGLELAPIGKLCHALRPTTVVHVLGDGNVLFDCDLRQSGEEMAEDADRVAGNGQDPLFSGSHSPPLVDSSLHPHRHPVGRRDVEPAGRQVAGHAV